VGPCVVGPSVIIFKARRNTNFFKKLSSRLFSKNPIVKKIFKFIFNDINHSKFNDFLLPRSEIYETINMHITSLRAYLDPPPPPPQTFKKHNEGLNVREG